MEFVAALLISYMIQLSLGYYAMFKVPLRGEIDGFAERSRIIAIVFAFVPWPFGAVVLQLVFLGIYLSKAKFIEARSQAVSEEWQRSAPAISSDANPFGNAGSRSDASQSPTQTDAENPFGVTPDRSVAPSANPFGDAASMSDASQSPTQTDAENPFGVAADHSPEPSGATDRVSREGPHGSPPTPGSNPFT